MACLAFAFFTCLSRVSDYKHHPFDVGFGALLGMTAQIVNVVFVLKLFDLRPKYEAATVTYSTPEAAATKIGPENYQMSSYQGQTRTENGIA